ncbi:MAG TPA: peptidylprolyl isomerase, partial [Fimbriimonas sp.]|nr:peptidylprolyl isomerase [Fimbriimonas sp.]
MDFFKSKQVKTSISLIGLAVVLAGCKGGGNEVYAVVNGESISKEEYISHLERKINVLVQTQQGPITAQVAQPLNFQALNDLVNQRLLLQMAKEEGVLPTSQDVQTELGFQEQKTPGFVKTLTSQGLTMTDIKNELMINLCRYKILSKGVTISEEQVNKYIKDNPKRFENPKTVDLTWIVVRSEKDKATVDSDLRANQIFSTVAKVNSVAPNGPVYPSRVYDQFPPRLKQVVDSLPEGGTSEWLQDSGSWVKFHVEKKTAASKLEIKPWMKV